MFYSNFSSTIKTGLLWALGVGVAVLVLILIFNIIFHKNEHSDKHDSLNDNVDNNINSTNACEISHSAIQSEQYDDTEYEKHKNEVFYQIRDKVLSEGEKLLQPHIEKFIDLKKYKLINNPNYSRYLKPNSDRPEKYQAISADKIKGLVADFGIETLDGKPVCFIEYDDSTHICKERQDRDSFLSSACYHARFPRIVITSEEFNSSISKDWDKLKIFYRRLYRKILSNLNPLNFPSLKCEHCGKELLVCVGEYGLFLSHGKYCECNNKINVIDLRELPTHSENKKESNVMYVSEKEYEYMMDAILSGKYEMDDVSLDDVCDEYEIRPIIDE